MYENKSIDDLAQKLTNLIPDSIKDTKADFEYNIKQILQSAFAKLDLVTREEFDAQVKVLQRTREKVDSLHQELLSLEQQISLNNKD